MMVLPIGIYGDVMERPKLDQRYTMRIPSELIDDVIDDSEHMNCSPNEILLMAAEEYLTRKTIRRWNYYTQIRTVKTTVTLEDQPAERLTPQNRMARKGTDDSVRQL